MLTSQRKHLILESLRDNGQIVAKELSLQWAVSEDTIRRDLRELAQEGLLQRVHGGALPTAGTTLASSPAVVNFKSRQKLAQASKNKLGQAAAKLVKAGQVIFIDGGTTNAQLVEHLPRTLKATVITHSPTIAVALMEHENIEVIIVGGKLFKHSAVTVGAAAIEAISRVRADIYFMGVTGVHSEVGLSTGDLEESYIKRAIKAAATETIVLASADKMNTASPYIICPCSDIKTIFTDAQIGDHTSEAFKKSGATIKRV
ncbi:DeoR/GlpR family DNA-binding transcription regulator [soil metagenome]